MHSTPTATKAQPAKPTQAAVCVSATVGIARETARLVINEKDGLKI